MRTAIKAAMVYWAMIFALGFLLGAIRTYWIVPALGDVTIAVLAEIPFMLAASWWCARTLVRRYAVDRTARRAVMGGLAFALLMAAEATVGLILAGEKLSVWLAGLWHMPGILGLAAQILFALFPLFQPPMRD